MDSIWLAYGHGTLGRPAYTLLFGKLSMTFVGVKKKYIFSLATYGLSYPMLSIQKFILYVKNRTAMGFGHRISYAGSTRGILYSMRAHDFCA